MFLGFQEKHGYLVSQISLSPEMLTSGLENQNNEQGTNFISLNVTMWLCTFLLGDKDVVNEQIGQKEDHEENKMKTSGSRGGWLAGGGGAGAGC